MLSRTIVAFAAIAAGVAIAPLHAATHSLPKPSRAAKPARIPDRLLTCSVRHVTNFDPNKEQTASELNYDSVHSLTLFLSGLPVRTTAPPEAYDKPEPVNRRTRITADPDGIAPVKGGKINRIIDYWPARTEISSPISGALLNVIVITAYDPNTATANFFMTRAAELTNFQADHIYQGQCKVRIGAAAKKPPMV